MIMLAASEIVTVGKFGAVGVVNTLLDFAIYNVLTTKKIGLTKIRANIVSTSITMVISFLLQKQVVFQQGDGNPWLQAVKFFAVTAVGLYLLQNAVIYLFTKYWKWPKVWVDAILKALHLNKLLSSDFALKNGAKVAGTVVSLTWNYLMYKRIVFTKS